MTQPELDALFSAGTAVHLGIADAINLDFDSCSATS
jgi:hypothetical protein